MTEQSMTEMVIDSIRVNIVNYQQRVVILKVKETNRFLPIWIGSSEADSIALKLQDIPVARPLTHDLLQSTIATLGATVSRIVVSDLTDDTFFAKIVLQVNGSSLEVDSRPSDALALAVRAEAPIFAHDEVIERAAVQMDEEGNPVSTQEEEEESPQPLREEELRSLSAFTDFVSTLDLDDIGGGGKTPSDAGSGS